MRQVSAAVTLINGIVGLPAALGNGTAEATTAASTTHRVLPDAAVTRAIVQRALENPQAWSIASLEASQQELAAHFSSQTHDAAAAYPLTLSSQPPERPDILTLCWAEAFGPDRGWSCMAPPNRSLLQMRPQVRDRVERESRVQFLDVTVIRVRGHIIGHL